MQSFMLQPLVLLHLLCCRTAWDAFGCMGTSTHAEQDIGFDNIEPLIGYDNNVLNKYFNEYLPRAVSGPTEPDLPT